MKDEEKKVSEVEEVKTEENGVELSDEEMAEVFGGLDRESFSQIRNPYFEEG